MTIKQFALQNGGTNAKSAFTTFKFTVSEAGDQYPIGTKVSIIIFTDTFTSKKGNVYSKGDYLVVAE